ncbi:MAG: adenylate kinase [Verrucomicrobiota bacterium]
MRVILLGPPASGKGTQAQFLKEHFDLPTVSTGELIREEIRRQSEIGRATQAGIEAGAFLADDLVREMIAARLAQLPDGFVLDGFPRTLPQAEALEGLLEESGQPLDHVFHLDVEEEVLLDRVLHRVGCPGCGRSFSEKKNPIAEGGPCPRPGCGGRLLRRKDDTRETLERRLGEYREKTRPLIGFYRERGLLRVLAGAREADEVFAQLREVLAAASETA